MGSDLRKQVLRVLGSRGTSGVRPQYLGLSPARTTPPGVLRVLSPHRRNESRKADLKVSITTSNTYTTLSVTEALTLRRAIIDHSPFPQFVDRASKPSEPTSGATVTSPSQPRRTRHSRYIRHVEPAGGPDPAVNAARALTTCIAAYRDLLSDDGYAAVLPAFEVLSAALPQAGPAVPAPRDRSAADHHSMDRGIA